MDGKGYWTEIDLERQFNISYNIELNSCLCSQLNINGGAYLNRSSTLVEIPTSVTSGTV